MHSPSVTDTRVTPAETSECQGAEVLPPASSAPLRPSEEDSFLGFFRSETSLRDQGADSRLSGLSEEADDFLGPDFGAGLAGGAASELGAPLAGPALAGPAPAVPAGPNYAQMPWLVEKPLAGHKHPPAPRAAYGRAATDGGQSIPAETFLKVADAQRQIERRWARAEQAEVEALFDEMERELDDAQPERRAR
ncbi:unnamed protein product [Symbiodinium natans]|uniref:Uncharacterized protein n=1 Tax=Symbiodinium natans TaxID=878477 RepID=A0A812J3L0_9DINO|nr:unnamed protein product [Symbiodinium natans]